MAHSVRRHEAGDNRNHPGSPAVAASDRSDLIVASIGNATLAVVGILVRATGLPREWVLDAIYRAPARLLPNLPHADAVQLAHKLRELGLVVRVAESGAPVTRPDRLDLAVRLLDHARTPAVADAVAQFIGTSPEAALALILTPPGVILGNIGRATVQALAQRMPAGTVELIYSESDQAQYALFAPGLNHQQQAILRQILPQGSAPDNGGGVTCFDLDKALADRLWRRLGMPRDVRIVNQEFLRFTLVLTAVPGNAEPAAAALEGLAGVPQALYRQVAAVLPCPLVDGIAYRDLPMRLESFRAAGFGVRADLETFSSQALEVRSARAETLAAAGIDGTAPLITQPMPLEHARFLRAQLESMGAEVLAA